MAEVFHDEESDKKSYLRNKPLQPFSQFPYKLILLLFAAALFSVLLTDYARSLGKRNILNSQTILSDRFRRHFLSESKVSEMRDLEQRERGASAGIYILNHWNRSGGREQSITKPEAAVGNDTFWKENPAWEGYLMACNAIWNDVVYFPVPVSASHENYTVSYVDSWMGERNYGGKRGHEGTDLMASEDQPGLYPVVSMTKGTVTSKGWLPKGGYRLGIMAPSGGYFYYAHLDSYADIEEGDEVDAGDILGFMGDSGYGPEGTTGMFATHLHVGIYIYPDGKEVSVNPYWILRVIEEKKLSCSF